MDYKAKNIYYVASYQISLLTPALAGQVEKGQVSFSMTVKVKLSTPSLYVLSKIE